MNITNRILTIKKLERKFNRTEFKVLFALAVVDVPVTLKQIMERTGVSESATKEAIKDLAYHNTIKQGNGLYSYNDDTDKWKTDVLMARNLGEPGYKVTV